MHAHACILSCSTAHGHGAQGVHFRVVVADAGPRFEGRELLRRLLAAGLRCTYVNLHALSYMMPEVTKLLLGASSMLLNGTLVSRAGIALVCMNIRIRIRMHAYAYMHAHARTCTHIPPSFAQALPSFACWRTATMCRC